MSCCPDGSLPALQLEYKARGEEIKVQDLDVYVVGAGAKAIVVAYDIFGFNGGRTRAMCDQFADQGYLVLLPDFFRGQAWKLDQPKDTLGEWLQTMPYAAGSRLFKDVHEVVLPYLKEERSVEAVAMAGFCWGAWLAFHVAATDGALACGVSFHPSVNLEQKYFAGSTVALAKAVTCPQLLMPAGNDDNDLKDGGAIIGALRSSAHEAARQSRSHCFDKVSHGYASRGKFEPGDEDMKRAVEESFKLAVDFLKAHL